MRALDPRFDLLASVSGDFALLFGKVDRALELYQENLARNPLDPNALDTLGQALCAAHRLQQCLQTRLTLAELHPEFEAINYSVGLAHLLLGQFAAALPAMQRESGENYRLRGLVMVYSALGRRADSDAALKELQEKFAPRDAYGIAQAYAYRGELDAAMGWLERAYRQHDAQMLYIVADPLLQNLHHDQRFQALLARLKLTERLSLARAVRA